MVCDRNFETLDKLMTEKRVGIYAGVDPTAPSLHVGHMVPFMVLGWAYITGIKSVFLVSSAVPMILGAVQANMSRESLVEVQPELEILQGEMTRDQS